jgi:hypothetical protein
MKRVVVRYKVKSDKVDENQRLIDRVFAKLDETAPAGLRYASFRLADGVSFVHVASIETDDGSNPLSALAEFADFTRDIDERCDEPPIGQDATLVGAYRLLGD